MTAADLENWLKQQHQILDRIIANAGYEFYSINKSKENFGFDLAECQYESFNLIRKEDLCYDRSNTAFCYSLWYHGRRVNTFLSHFAKAFLNSDSTEIEIFDLGAGTGAVQWAIGLIYHKMKLEGLNLPKIRIINIDSSPFMLYYNRDFLWKHFKNVYYHCQDFTSNIEYEINTWSNNQNVTVTNPWITASYLFDISDTSTGNELSIDYKVSVKKGFQELIKNFRPSTILLLTADQPTKRLLLNELNQEFINTGYNHQQVSNNNLILTGILNETTKFRQLIYENHKNELKSSEAKAIGNSVSWTDYSFIGTILTQNQAVLNLPSESPKNVPAIQLYNSAIKVRREIVLNDEQKKASEHSDRPTIITGPAGCGKSVVITERIKNLIEEKNYDISLEILVTTFNKQLMTYLGTWIEDLLDKEKVVRNGNSFKFIGSEKTNIILLNFDILPTRLGYNIATKDIGFTDYHKDLISRCITDIKREHQITTNIYDNVLNPDYILDEYQRIIYGLQLVRKEEYLSAERKGRPKLQINGTRRHLLWGVIIDKYLSQIEKDSFIIRRHRFLKQLKNKVVNKKYSHIFVDEFQDCTSADYEIFYNLLVDPNNLVLAGDISQAIQLGAVADIPRAEGDLMQRRVIHRLKGSYRLPFRISECITKISENIQNGNVITPYKSSPPGARPIIVYGNNSTEIYTKLKAIYETYNIYQLDRITIIEKDNYLNFQFMNNGILCETDTILKLKGLEKSCVVWATWKDIEYKQEIAEFVYTILSRTSGILIIALTPQTLRKYNYIINMLRKDRLIFWDAITKTNFSGFCIDHSEKIFEED